MYDGIPIIFGVRRSNVKASKNRLVVALSLAIGLQKVCPFGEVLYTKLGA